MHFSVSEDVKGKKTFSLCGCSSESISARGE